MGLQQACYGVYLKRMEKWVIGIVEDLYEWIMSSW